MIALYIDEPHTPRADAIRNATLEPGWFTPLHQVEWEHALVRRLRLGDLTESAAGTLRQELAQDIANRVWGRTDWPEGLAERSVALASEFGRRTAMRTLDTLHVAAALELEAREFWTLDQEQAQLAEMAGLRVP